MHSRHIAQPSAPLLKHNEFLAVADPDRANGFRLEHYQHSFSVAPDEEQAILADELRLINAEIEHNGGANRISMGAMIDAIHEQLRRVRRLVQTERSARDSLSHLSCDEVAAEVLG